MSYRLQDITLQRTTIETVTVEVLVPESMGSEGVLRIAEAVADDGGGTWRGQPIELRAISVTTLNDDVRVKPVER